MGVKNTKNSLIFASALSMMACSGGGGASSSGGSGSSLKLNVDAQFIDAPVNGLTWSVVGQESINGRTQGLGNFSCTRGQLISFEIGQVGKGLHLGNAVCGEKIFVMDLDSVELDEDANKIGAILQTVAPPSADLSVPMAIPAGLAALDLTADILGLPSRTAKNQTFNGSNAPEGLRAAFGGIVSSIASNNLVSTVDARAHMDSAVSSYTDTDSLASLFGSYAIPTAELPHSANFNSPESREKEIRLFKRGSGACNIIDLDFFLGIEKTDDDKYFAYGYSTYDTDDVMYGYDTKTYCETIYGVVAPHVYDEQCFGTYVFPKKRMYSNSISVRSKFKDYDIYLENHQGGAVNLDDAVALYDAVGSLYLDGARLKGRIVLSLEDGLDQDEYGHLPSACTFDIDQAFDEEFEDEEDDYSSHYPAFAFGQWTNEDAASCTGEEFLDYNSPGSYGVSIGSSNVVDYVYSNGELGDIVGYTTTEYESSNWIVFQQFTNGFFKATFVNENNVSYTFERADGDSCSGSFVPYIEP